MNKRLISSLLAAAMVCSLAPAAFADDTQSSDPQTSESTEENAFVNQWTAFVEASQLGNTVVPGSEMKYSEVPDIQKVLAEGYSQLWETTEANGEDVLASLKAELLQAVKDYNLYLLDAVYNEGEGYTVGETTYYLPEEAYTAAKQAIQNAKDIESAITSYTTALSVQYPYDAQVNVDAWTAFVEASQLGDTVVPGSEMKYSEVPDIQKVLAEGYSKLWETKTEQAGAETLASLKEELLQAVKDYNLYLLDAVYSEGEGYTVGETTYVMPEQAYTIAKQEITKAAEIQDSITAYETALQAQYANDEVAIEKVGFKALGSDANAAINAWIQALDGKEGTVSDSDANTMYIGLNRRTGTDTNQAYTVRVEKGNSTVYETDIAANQNAGVIYFTFETEKGSSALTGIEAGTYTVSLLKQGWTDPINTVTVDLAQITFDTNGGSAAPAAFYGAVGDTVALPAAPTNSGYNFAGWSDGTNSYTGSTFTVPALQTVALQAQWNKQSSSHHSSSSGSSNYTLTFETNGGSTLNPVAKSSGTTIDLASYTPTKEGYTFAGWYSDSKLTEKVTSVKLTQNTSVYAKWTADSQTPVTGGCDYSADCVVNQFKDIADTAWYHQAVDYVVDEGLMNGTGTTTFAPTTTTTRGMLMTMLARLDGTDTTGGATWYEKGMNWAVAKGVSDGTNPANNITREQLVAMLYRYAGSPAATGNLSAYADGAKVSSWATTAMQWAVESKVISGKGNGTLDPQGYATRAEVAQILMNYNQ